MYQRANIDEIYHFHVLPIITNLCKNRQIIPLYKKKQNYLKDYLKDEVINGLEISAIASFLYNNIDYNRSTDKRSNRTKRQ